MAAFPQRDLGRVGPVALPIDGSGVDDYTVQQDVQGGIGLGEACQSGLLVVGYAAAD